MSKIRDYLFIWETPVDVYYGQYPEDVLDPTIRPTFGVPGLEKMIMEGEREPLNKAYQASLTPGYETETLSTSGIFVNIILSQHDDLWEYYVLELGGAFREEDIRDAYLDLLWKYREDQDEDLRKVPEPVLLSMANYLPEEHYQLKYRSAVMNGIDTVSSEKVYQETLQSLLKVLGS